MKRNIAINAFILTIASASAFLGICIDDNLSQSGSPYTGIFISLFTVIIGVSFFQLKKLIRGEG